MNEATRILAIRHGQTAWNAAARIQGHTDIELDDTGQWQARRVAQALGDEDLQAIYSSDLARARDTAAPLAALHGLPVGIDEGLRERGFGTLAYINAASAAIFSRMNRKNRPGPRREDCHRRKPPGSLRSASFANSNQTDC